MAGGAAPQRRSLIAPGSDTGLSSTGNVSWKLVNIQVEKKIALRKFHKRLSEMFFITAFIYIKLPPPQGVFDEINLVAII